MDFISATEGKDYSIGLGKPATFIASRDDSGQVQRRFLDAGQSAPVGAIVYYFLPAYMPADRTADDPSSVRARLAEEVYREKFGIDAVSETTSAAAVADAADQISVSLAFLDERGEVVREFRPKPAGYDKLSDEDKALDPGPWMPVRAGVNRFVWDLRHAGASRLRGNRTGEEAERGPLALPGTCSVRLRLGFQNPVPCPPPGPDGQAGGTRFELVERTDGASFEIVNDPRSPTSPDDLRDQLDLLLEIRDKMSALYEGGAAHPRYKGRGRTVCARGLVPGLGGTKRRSKLERRCARLWLRSSPP